MCRTQCVLALATLYVGLVHSWDIAVSLGDQLQFYNDGTKTDTVHLKNHNLTKITYDEVINMMLFIDKQRDYDAICGYSLSFKNVKCFVKRYGSNIVDLAFDPPTNKVFFTDTKDKSINWISLNFFESESNKHGNLLINMVDRTPTDIEVDSCNGFIYWTNSERRHYGYYMERARLNGSEIHVVEQITPINNFAIDLQTHQKFFFTGSNYDLLTKADLRVKNRRSKKVNIYYNKTRSCQELTVSKDYLYWTQSSASDLTIWQKLKNSTKIRLHNKVMYRFQTTHKLSIAANYRIKDQIHGLQDCEALKRVIPILEMTTALYWSAGGAEISSSTPELDWSTEITETYSSIPELYWPTGSTETSSSIPELDWSMGSTETSSSIPELDWSMGSTETSSSIPELDWPTGSTETSSSIPELDWLTGSTETSRSTPELDWPTGSTETPSSTLEPDWPTGSTETSSSITELDWSMGSTEISSSIPELDWSMGSTETSSSIPELDWPTGSTETSSSIPELDWLTGSTETSRSTPELDWPTGSTETSSSTLEPDWPTGSIETSSSIPELDWPMGNTETSSSIPELDWPTGSTETSSSIPELDWSMGSTETSSSIPELDWPTGSTETSSSIPELDWPTESTETSSSTPELDSSTEYIETSSPGSTKELDSNWSTDTELTEQTSELYETAETADTLKLHKAAGSNKNIFKDENGELDWTTQPDQTSKTEIHACHGYCLNNGNCTLNKKSEPVCHCKGDYVGDRCEVSGCLNYCFQGSCSLSDEGHRKCRCNAGYSGARCEVYSCQSFCLNSGVCSLNNQEKPVCQCVGNHEGTRCEAVKTNTFSFTPQTYSANRNLTLADLLSNWQKPAVKVSVFVEV